MGVMNKAWTAEMVDELTKLSKNRWLSAAGIAQRLNETCGTSFTRNAIVGALSRRGLRAPDTRRVVRHLPPPSAKKEPGMVSAVRARARGAEDSGLAKSIKNRTGEKAILSGDEATDLAAEEFPNRIPLMAARDHHCRWPAADDGSGSMVCGAPVHDRSYCHHHYTRSVRSRQP